jgi:DNA-binding beta-propeller fold protein YncE
MIRPTATWTLFLALMACDNLPDILLDDNNLTPEDTDALLVEAGVLTVPLGETLFFDGDDYLSFWGKDHPDTVQIIERPAGSVAEPTAGGTRWTPDVAGRYLLRRGEEDVPLQIDDAPVDVDHFLNYNYTPVLPIAKVDEDTLLVTAPYGNVVQRVTVTDAGAEVVERIPAGSWPTSVVIWPGSGYALVAQTGRDTLGFLDLATMRITDAVRVGDEPAGIVVDGDLAYVTLSGADEVARVDLQSRSVTGRVKVGRDPRALALDTVNGRLFVASLLSSNTTPLGPLQSEPVDPATQQDIAVIRTGDFTVDRFIPEVGTILRGLHLSPDGNTLTVGMSHSLNTRHLTNAEVEPHQHGLVVVDVTPDGAFDQQFIDLMALPGAEGPAPSPFSMETAAGGELIVTLSAGEGVLVLDPSRTEILARVDTGSDPRGLVFAHGRAWTTTWLDNTLEGIRLPAQDQDAADVTVVLGDDPRPAEVRDGQRMFNDASFSLRNDFSCNNCHIDGLADGLVWNLLADGDVNTLAFRNIGGTDPFLWGGQLPTLFDFSREVLRLVGASASGAQMELLTTYMQSVTAPPNPFADPGGKLSASGQRGEALFFGSTAEGGAGCGTCHSGPLFSNGAMVDGKTEGMLTDVPALIGVYDTAPYGRQGQWRTIEEMVVYAAGFTGASLSPADLEDLSAFIREIPGDALYLNSARPLSGADHVWFETPLELVFSQVLKPGQKALFNFEEVLIGATEPVAGEWTVSGRRAVFVPEQPLEHLTRYRMTVDAGLEGSLGYVLYEPIKVDFSTGDVPEVDVSGEWYANLLVSQVALPFDVDFDVGGGLALLQAQGGNITGVITTELDEAEFDHVRGVTSGTTVVLEAFRVPSVIGDVMVDESNYEMVDEDGDGWADHGVGTVSALGFTVPVELTRTSYPDGEPTVP